MSLRRHSNKFVRYTKTFLKTYTQKFLNIQSIPNPHRNHKETELDYFEKNKKDQKLPFSDLIFIFWGEFHFLCDVCFAFRSCHIQSLTFTTDDTGKLWW